MTYLASAHGDEHGNAHGGIELIKIRNSLSKELLLKISGNYPFKKAIAFYRK